MHHNEGGQRIRRVEAGSWVERSVWRRWVNIFIEIFGRGEVVFNAVFMASGGGGAPAPNETVPQISKIMRLSGGPPHVPH